MMMDEYHQHLKIKNKKNYSIGPSHLDLQLFTGIFKINAAIQNNIIFLIYSALKIMFIFSISQHYNDVNPLIMPLHLT